MTGTHTSVEHWAGRAILTFRAINPADIEFLPFQAPQGQPIPCRTDKTVLFFLIGKLLPCELCFIIYAARCPWCVQANPHIFQRPANQACPIRAVRPGCFDRNSYMTAHIFEPFQIGTGIIGISWSNKHIHNDTMGWIDALVAQVMWSCWFPRPFEYSGLRIRGADSFFYGTFFFWLIA